MISRFCKSKNDLDLADDARPDWMRESDHCREMVGATSFLHPDISIFESVFCDYIVLVQNRSPNIEFENCIHIILFFDSEQMHIVCQIKSRSESFCEY